MNTVSDVTNYVLIKAGFYKGSIGKIVFAVMLIVYLVAACHFIGCSWISIAKMTPCSWIEQGYSDSERCNMGPMINKSDDNTVYTTAVYWVITTLTTVGYGDIKGYTPPEYFFQMVIEFLGIGVFSFLMNCISDLFTTDTTMQNIIDIRTE